MSELKVERVTVWVVNLQDRTGDLAQVLTKLSEVNADLDFVIARRTPEKPGEGVVFLTPLRNDKQEAVAAELGLDVIESVETIRVEGPNGIGEGARVCSALAEQGLNLHGFSAASIGDRWVVYIGLDNAEDAARAERVLSLISP